MHMHIQNNISFPSPSVDVELVEVPGKDGSLVVPNNRLNDVTFAIPVTLKLPDDKSIEMVATDISNWLKSDIGWSPLRFSGSPEWEYIALFYEQFDIQETLKTYGRTSLRFRLRPYKRLRSSPNVVLTNGQTLLNKGGRISKPLIKITGNGNITLKNNEKDWLVLINVDSEIVIDTESMSVYKDTTPHYEKMLSHLKPLFPVLYMGENIITWTGSVTKLEITPRWEAIT